MANTSKVRLNRQLYSFELELQFFFIHQDRWRVEHQLAVSGRPGSVPSTRQFAKIPMWWSTFATSPSVRTRFVWPTPRPSVESILAADVITPSTIRPPDAKSTARPDWANARGKCRPYWTRPLGPSKAGRGTPSRWSFPPRPALTNTIWTDIPHRKAMPKSCPTLYSPPSPSTAADCAARWKKRKNPPKRPWWKLLLGRPNCWPLWWKRRRRKFPALPNPLQKKKRRQWMPVPANYWSVQSMTACWARTDSKKPFPNDRFQLFAMPSNPVSARQFAHGPSCECWPSSPEAPLALISASLTPIAPDRPVAARANADLLALTQSSYQLLFYPNRALARLLPIHSDAHKRLPMTAPPMPTVPAGLNVAPTDAHPSALHPKVCPATCICPAELNTIIFYTEGSTGPLMMSISPPVCTLKGDYAREQSQGEFSWCVDAAGQPIDDSFTRGSVRCSPNGTVLEQRALGPICADPSVQPAVCRDQCLHARCPFHPDALCVADPCNQCKVSFIDAQGHKVECTDRCSQPAETGHCRALFPRYFYNATAQTCQEFVYGGCEGNENNFESVEECQEHCVKPGGKITSNPSETGEIFNFFPFFFLQ